MQQHLPDTTPGSMICRRCGEPTFNHRLEPAQCPHPASASVDHADNPSRYRCGLCDTRFVDIGNGYQSQAA